MDQLAGKTAVITGGGSGIGREIALAFAAEGMNIVVADIVGERAAQVASEIAATGAASLAVPVDVTDAASVEALADAAYAAFGAVNLLCNNAGVVYWGPAAEVPQADWDWLFKVNLWGVVNGVRSFVPRMRAQGAPAHIVNTASTAGLFAVPGLGLYTASKYAVVGLTETLRQELSLDGIEISCFCPGPTATRLGETARSNLDPNAPRLPRSKDPIDKALTEMRDTAEVAAHVVAGVKANRPYIFSHLPSKGATERRVTAILAAFDHAS